LFGLMKQNARLKLKKQSFSLIAFLDSRHADP
jgi:hypothetical protein